MAKARAIATRCCWPPDSSSGIASALCSKPTRLSRRMAFSLASSLDLPRTCIGASMMFCRTVMFGNRLNLWKTMPTSRRMAFRFAPSSSLMPSITISPPLGVSKWFRQRRIVLLPLPDGPIITTTSFSLISRLISLRTVTSPNFLERCLTEIIVFESFSSMIIFSCL